MNKVIILLLMMGYIPTIWAQQVISMAPVHDSLDVNMVNARINSEGSLFWDLIGSPKFEVPKGSGRHTIFASNLWMGVMDVNANIKVSAQTYSQNGNDYGYGPISTPVNYDSSFNANWDRLWKITKNEVDYHILHWNDPTYQLPNSIADYPANGDVSKGQDAIFAPYQDVNANNTYDPQNGDYPLIKGDMSVLFLINDMNCPHNESNGIPLGVQVLGTMYGFDAPNDDVLNHTVFLSYKITNHSGLPYQDYKVGMWCDIDLGMYADDYIGCDSTNNYFYGYNGDNDDEGGTGYGTNPPAEAVLFLNYPMQSFFYYNNDWSVTGSPQYPIHYYNYLTSKWKDGLPVVNNLMNGYPLTAAGSPTNYIFEGDVCNNVGWTEISANNKAADRRGLGVVSIPLLNDNQSVEVDIAFVYARGSSNINSVCALQDNVSYLQNLYNDNALDNDYPRIFDNDNLAQVFPNPVQDDVTLRFKDNDTHQVILYDAMGHKLWQANDLQGETLLNMRKYITGTYFLQIDYTLQQLVKQ